MVEAKAMEIWTQAFAASVLTCSDEKAAAVIAEALAARDARIVELEGALGPFVEAIGRVNLSRQHDDNRVHFRWGKSDETWATVGDFLRARQALETKHG